MTDIYQKAQALLLKAQGEYPNCDPYTAAVLVLERAIEAHEATEQKLHDFRQEVSDAIRADVDYQIANKAIPQYRSNIVRFYSTAPKPDPLVDVMKDLSWDEETAAEDWATDLRAALEARGLEIREKNDGV